MKQVNRDVVQFEEHAFRLGVDLLAGGSNVESLRHWGAVVRRHQGGQQSTNEQSRYLIDRLLMSAGLRLIDCLKIEEIDRLDRSIIPRRGCS
jgi:hypothetical protein